MQPYLAYNLGTTTPSINLVWTLGFSGYLIGSTLTSHLFTKHLQKGAFLTLSNPLPLEHLYYLSKNIGIWIRFPF